MVAIFPVLFDFYRHSLLTISFQYLADLVFRQVFLIRSFYYIAAISSTPSTAHNLHPQTRTQEGRTLSYLKPKPEKCVFFTILYSRCFFLFHERVRGSTSTSSTLDKISLFCFISDAKFCERCDEFVTMTLNLTYLQVETINLNHENE